MTKIGIVGLGLKNPYTYAPILKKQGAKVVAVYDTYPELVKEYAQKFNCIEVYNIHEYPNVDGVIIASINSEHLELGSFFLSRNIPVFIEKPLTNNVDDALSFIDKYKGKPWFSASPLRFSPIYNQMARDILLDKSKIQYCRVAVIHTMSHFMSDPLKKWHDCPNKGGGMLIDIGIHAVELLNMVKPVNNIKHVNYIKSSSNYKESLSKDNHHINFFYKDGSCASINLLCATSHLDYSVEAYTLDNKYLNQKEIPYLKNQGNPEDAYGGFEKTIEAFLKMIKTKQPPISHNETKRNFLLLKDIISRGEHKYE